MSARGNLQLFRTQASLEQAEHWARLLEPLGMSSRALSCTEVIEHEPALAPLEQLLVGGRHYASDIAADAHRYCAELTRILGARGVKFEFGHSVSRLVTRHKRVVGIVDEQGRELCADTYLLAAGTESPRLARTAGIYLPIVPVKGYSITFERQAGTPMPEMPVVDRDRHIAVVPVGRTRVRAVGLAQFAGHDLTVEPQSVARLRRCVTGLLPFASALLQSSSALNWAGLRPMCADGSPIIGASALDNLFLNTGHGQLGSTLAAGSGRLAADIIFGAKPELDPQPFSAARFLAR